MSKDGLSPVWHIIPLAIIQLQVKILNLGLRLALPTLSLRTTYQNPYLVMLGLLIISSWISKLLGGMIWNSDSL